MFLSFWQGDLIIRSRFYILSFIPGKNCGINTEIATEDNGSNRPCGIAMQPAKEISLTVNTARIKGNSVLGGFYLPWQFEYNTWQSNEPGSWGMIRGQGNLSSNVQQAEIPAKSI